MEEPPRKNNHLALKIVALAAVFAAVALVIVLKPRRPEPAPPATDPRATHEATVRSQPPTDPLEAAIAKRLPTLADFGRGT